MNSYLKSLIMNGAVYSEVKLLEELISLLLEKNEE